MKRCKICGKKLTAIVSQNGSQLAWECPTHGHVSGEIRGSPKIGIIEMFFIRLTGNPIRIDKENLNVIMKVSFNEVTNRIILETAKLSEQSFQELRSMMMKAERLEVDTKTDGFGCTILTELTDR